jgi:hypothetical protein
MRLRGRRRRHTLQRVCRRYILALTCDYLADNDTRSRVRGADRPHAGRTRGDARTPPGLTAVAPTRRRYASDGP